MEDYQFMAENRLRINVSQSFANNAVLLAKKKNKKIRPVYGRVLFLTSRATIQPTQSRRSRVALEIMRGDTLKPQYSPTFPNTLSCIGKTSYVYWSHISKYLKIFSEGEFLSFGSILWLVIPHKNLMVVHLETRNDHTCLESDSWIYNSRKMRSETPWERYWVWYRSWFWEW